MNDLLYICVKNPFSKRDLERMGVEALEEHFDLRILDCTAWLMPTALAIRSQSFYPRHNVRPIHSLRELRNELADKRGGYAVDYVGQFSPQAVLLFNELKSKRFELIVMDSGAYPSPALILGKRSHLSRLMEAVRHGGLRRHIEARVVRLMLSLLPDQKPDYAFVAGSSWRADPRFSDARQHIPAHSFDYERYLQVRNEPALRKDEYAVYLDEDITGHEDDADLGLSHPATEKVFYPVLNGFFDKFERAAGVPVIVAGYPSADKESLAVRFGGREVFVGKTAALIRNARLVFAHASTAISYAVLWRRPIVFLTSREIMGSWYHRWIEAPQKLLEAPMIDLDRTSLDFPLREWSHCDGARYKNYEETYIKSKDSPEMSLWEIFLAIKACSPRGLLAAEA